jgi:hypothetical protein
MQSLEHIQFSTDTGCALAAAGPTAAAGRVELPKLQNDKKVSQKLKIDCAQKLSLPQLGPVTYLQQSVVTSVLQTMSSTQQWVILRWPMLSVIMPR